MEFRNLYSFLRVAELGSVTKAANELGYAQSTVTTQIKQLEAEIGYPLFEHIGRRVTLTLHGQQLIPFANQILTVEQQIQQLNHTNPAEIHGVLKIGIVESIMNSLLIENIKTYRERFPNVMLQIYPAVTVPLFEMLHRNEVDLIFAMGNHFNSAGSICACSHDERAVFISSIEHPLAQREELSLSEVIAQPLILTGDITFLRAELTKEAYNRGLELNPVIQTESSNIIIRLVRQNLGISFLPEHLAYSAFMDGKIAILPVSDYSLSYQVHIFYHKNKFLSPQMIELIQIIQDYWKNHDQSIDPFQST